MVRVRGKVVLARREQKSNEKISHTRLKNRYILVHLIQRSNSKIGRLSESISI